MKGAAPLVAIAVVFGAAGLALVYMGVVSDGGLGAAAVVAFGIAGAAGHSAREHVREEKRRELEHPELPPAHVVVRDEPAHDRAGARAENPDDKPEILT